MVLFISYYKEFDLSLESITKNLLIDPYNQLKRTGMTLPVDYKEIDFQNPL